MEESRENLLTADEQEFLAEADAYIERNWEAIVADIAELVAVPSVVDWAAATPEDPSGPDAHAGLRAAVGLAERLGFDAHDEAGEIGWADLPGESDVQLAMICHADVVVPGVGWTGSPWDVRRRDGFLVGRGVLDDKGPLVVALHCMRFLRERCERLGRRLPYTIRMIIGTNEETGTMRDVKHYLAHHPAPAFLFTPDASFPVGYGEKGGFDGLFTSGVLEGGAIADFTTGDAARNAVPSQAVMTVRADAAKLPGADHIEATDVGGGLVRLVAMGRGGHASLPEGTVNAIGLLADYALAHVAISEAEGAYLRMIRRIVVSTDGSSLGIDASDEYFGPLTCVASTIHKEGGRLRLTIDVRFPTSTSPAKLLEGLAPVAEEGGAAVKNTQAMAPYLVKPDSPAIQALAAAYRDATGLGGEPFTMGGGTYAREFPCAASFGPEDPHDEWPEWVGPMHGADEGVSEAALKRAMRVYLLAMKRLMEVDLKALGA